MAFEILNTAVKCSRSLFYCVADITLSGFYIMTHLTLNKLIKFENDYIMVLLMLIKSA